MSLIVEFRMRSPEFPLAPTLDAVPDARLEVMREAGTEPERPVIVFWVACHDAGAFDDALSQDPTVEDVQRCDSVDGRELYQVQVSEGAGVVTYPTGVELGIVPFETVWEDGWWRLKAQFPRREHVAAAREWCAENGVDFELEGVFSRETQTSDVGLTDEQRKVLDAALDLGYFEIPREASLADVAAALDISSQAVSERLRRAYRQLAAATRPE